MSPHELSQPSRRSAEARRVCDRLKGNVNDVSYKYERDEKTNVSFDSSHILLYSSRNSTKRREQKLNLVAIGSKSGYLVTMPLTTSKIN